MRSLFIALLLLAISCGSAAAWVTHVIYTIQQHMWVLLFVGSLIAPIGVIHGVMIWFGHGWG